MIAMAEPKRIEIAIDPDQLDALTSAVDNGQYPSLDDAVRAALSRWREEQIFDPVDIARLRKLLDEGEASGPAVEIDFDDLRREARARLASKGGNPGR